MAAALQPCNPQHDFFNSSDRENKAFWPELLKKSCVDPELLAKKVVVRELLKKVGELLKEE